MVTRPLTLGSRDSRLARAQVEEAIAAIDRVLEEPVSWTRRFFKTPGDRDKTTPLDDPAIPDDYFTRDLDEACLRGEIDLAVHSAKDLPETLPDGILLAALFPSRDIRDALVFRRDWDADRPPATIGTSSERRAASALAFYPDARTVPIRGDVQNRVAQVDAGGFDVAIIAACALERLGMADRISRYLPGDPAPQQGRLAITVRADNHALARELRALDIRRTAGLVALIGCPADPAMISERVERYLRHADIVLHDRLIPHAVLATIHDKAVDVGKTAGRPSTPQSEINRRMLMEAERGQLVARLQGGDPGIFGHLGEEIDFLSQWNIRIDVVPGVSAAQVAAARAHVSLTHRHQGRSITFVTGQPGAGQESIPFPPPEQGHLAVYMGARNRAAVQRQLLDAGWMPDASVLIAECIGDDLESSFFTRIDRLAGLDVRSPAVLLVGPGAPAMQVTTLFTGTNPSYFLKQGPLLHWPMIELSAEPAEARAAALDAHLADVDGILFPSRFAVRCFVESLFPDRDVRALAGKRLLAVGPATEAELRRAGLRADAAAESLGGVRALAQHLADDMKGRYLYPCSDAAPRERRKAFLAPLDIELVPAVFYRNQSTPERPLPRIPFHRVLFTSSTTVETYFARYPEEEKASRAWLAVGPSTLETLEARGLEGEIIPS